MSEPNEIDPNAVQELARARADLKNLRADLRNAQAEADSLRQRLDASESAAAEAKKVSDQAVAAAVAERDKAQADAEVALTDAKTAGEKALISAKAETLATKLGAHSPEDVVRLVDLSSVTRDDAGNFKGISEVLEAAKTERAYLFSAEPTSDGQQGNTTTKSPKPNAPTTAKSVSDMSEEEYAEARRSYVGY